MGKEKDKKPLFGGIFQKFFKPSAKAEAKKKKEHHPVSYTHLRAHET